MQNQHYFLVLLLLSVASCATQKPEYYKAKEFVPVNVFTSGVEGPAVDRNGIVYAVNFQKEGTIGRITPDGKAELFVNLPQGSTGNGIRFNSKGEMFVADYTGHNILKVDPSTKNVTVFAHESSMSQPNDIAIDKHDRLYASDPNWKQGTGRIWRIDTNGQITLLDSMDAATNGIEVSADEKHLYVNASGGVFVYDLSDDGVVSNRRELIRFKEFGMDGMRCDVKGNLYITRFGKGTVVKLSPEGKVLNEIPLTGKRVTNIAFGGPDGKTAYVTLMDRGNLETFRVEDAGREWRKSK